MKPALIKSKLIEINLDLMNLLNLCKSGHIEYVKSCVETAISRVAQIEAGLGLMLIDDVREITGIIEHALTWIILARNDAMKRRYKRSVTNAIRNVESKLREVKRDIKTISVENGKD